MRGLRVRVAEEVAIVVEGNVDPGLCDHLKAALQAELGRLGFTVVRASDKSFDLSLRIETRVTGAVSYVRGRVGLTAERGGLAVAQASSGVELHSNGEFPTFMTQRAVAELLHSPALAEFAKKQGPSREVVRDRIQPVAAAPAPAKGVRNPTGEAKAHSNRGTSMYNLGRFSEALAEYEAAYLAVQDPPFLFNIAQCHRKMGKNKEALESYRTYLRVAPEAPNRAEVQKRISELEHQVHAAR
jgi:tetratricopeptide (TPR) repeat protein